MAGKNRGGWIVKLVGIILIGYVLITVLGGENRQKNQTDEPVMEVHFCERGTKSDVYEELLSIEPIIGVYSTVNGVSPSGTYSNLICKAETACGSTIYVLMNAARYQEQFDPGINLNIGAYLTADKIDFNAPKKVHGVTALTSKYYVPMYGQESKVTDDTLLQIKTVD